MPNDIVTYDGTTYICITAVYGNTTPDLDSAWAVYARGGPTGFTGPPGNNSTVPGPQGNQGTTGPAPDNWSTYAATTFVDLSNNVICNASNVYGVGSVTLSANPVIIISDSSSITITSSTANIYINSASEVEINFTSFGNTGSNGLKLVDASGSYGWLSVNGGGNLCWNGTAFT
jgi:hypothetical protein